MKTVIYGQDDRFSDWVSERLDENFLNTVAIGLEEDGELIAGVVYDNYTKAGINMHIAAEDGRRWLNRDYLFRCFAYPFLQLGCRRVTGLSREDNVTAHKFIEHLGFRREGLIREAYRDGMNVILYGMLKDECRWIKGK